jgi:flavin-dependent dehydrogenase
VKARGHLVPLGGADRVLHKGRVLLTGDAAGLAEPITGEGIYYAVRSAIIAADVVYRALRHGTGDLSSYSAEVNAEITRDLRYARRLARLLYLLPRLSYRFFIANPMVQSGMTNVIYGRSSFEQLCGDLLKNAPRLLFSALH